MNGEYGVLSSNSRYCNILDECLNLLHSFEKAAHPFIKKYNPSDRFVYKVLLYNVLLAYIKYSTSIFYLLKIGDSHSALILLRTSYELHVQQLYIRIKPELFSSQYLSFADIEFKKSLDKITQVSEEIQILFDQFSIEALSPLYPEERSIKRINRSIYEFFKSEFPMQFEYASIKEQMIVLANSNRQPFYDVVNLAKENYLADVEKRSKELAIDENWEIPRFTPHSAEYVRNEFELSIMQPFYHKNNTSKVELNFAIFLNNKKEELEWWFKNGERDGTFFAVPRKDGDDNVPFYVDWIVKYQDGRIGLFDTKGGLTAKTAGSRAKGLSTYIKEQNDNGKNLFGGIVIEKSGSFWMNPGPKYEYNENDLSSAGWQILS